MSAEPCPQDWRVRYATPPEETPNAKKKRLQRKRLAEYRHRRRIIDDTAGPEPSETRTNNRDEEPCPQDWRVRYAKPPVETPDAKKKRLQRKRQAECRHRRRTIDDTTGPEPSETRTNDRDEEPCPQDWRVRYATPPEETPAAKQKRLQRKRQAEYRHRRRIIDDTAGPEPSEMRTNDREENLSSHELQVAPLEDTHAARSHLQIYRGIVSISYVNLLQQLKIRKLINLHHTQHIFVSCIRIMGSVHESRRSKSCFVILSKFSVAKLDSSSIKVFNNLTPASFL